MTNGPGGAAYSLPLVVAVTGHRNLAFAEIESIRERTRSLFEELRTRFPAHRLTLMSPLAEGADTLAAEVALEEQIDLIVPIPKPMEAYLRDFRSAEARQRFEALCNDATDVFELYTDQPPAPDGVPEEVWDSDYPYAALGTFLCAHCHVLLAVWDGKPSTHLGGTAQVVRFHQDDIMPGITPVTVATQQMLVDDESDLVFHIVCSRAGEGGEPAPGLKPGDYYWYSKDEQRPRSLELPPQHELIFGRSDEFSADAQRFAGEVGTQRSSLLTREDGYTLPEGLRAINQLFCIADQLAIHYQRRTLVTLKATHLLAFLMGMMFILYSDLETWRYFLLAFLAFFATSVGVQFLAKDGGWHRKYMDYRALAEGLRVQFYWAAAGVTSESRWKYAHDSFLRSHDPELGWIRNVMRAAGIRCDATPNTNPSGLEFALREWVGDENTGQLGYFKRRAHDRVRRHSLTSRLGKLSLAVSVVTVVFFLFVGPGLPTSLEAVLTVIMGGSLLLYAVREGYAYATAVKELIRQYEFMLRIYWNAHRRLSKASEPSVKRQILSALGQSALDEHSDWLMMHRGRLFGDGENWHLRA